MVESIISGVVDCLTKELTSWKVKTKHSVMRIACCVIVWWRLKTCWIPVDDTADAIACAYLAYLKEMKLVRVRIL
ncbi:hypothetical protein DPMN_062901 [Dreissena polymorpha]|uniref:Uncharacterized protein n=1 Tax=Dreissena polymorpha TaxID=45954 RepID=A0A9D4C9H9_DREPO|nr:hypothetical protein DPMN_062901 [Dreissena polymorpha]